VESDPVAELDPGNVRAYLYNGAGHLVARRDRKMRDRPGAGSVVDIRPTYSGCIDLDPDVVWANKSGLDI
jgi:YD repeat-containing protein